MPPKTKHAKPKVVAFNQLTPWQQAGVRCLRVTHFLLARSGLFVAFFILCLFSERASRESQPPIHPWIIYLHVGIYLVTSTGMSSRLLPTVSVIVAAVFYTHFAYVLAFQASFGYPPWLRIRAALRFVALAGASLRMLAAGQFDPARLLDKVTAGLSGCVCALMGVLSLPPVTPALVRFGATAHRHEVASAFDSVFQTRFIHWVIGSAFFVAFLAYSFPIMALLPPGESQSTLFKRMVSWADRLACVGWVLTLFCKDTNWAYWDAQKVDFWLQNSLILCEFLAVTSILVGASLPWLGRVSNPDRPKTD